MEAMTSVGRYIGQHMERRRAEEAVRRGEAVRGAVLESAIDSVITMNHEGRVVEFNPAAERRSATGARMPWASSCAS